MNSTKTMPKKSKTNLIELVESKYKKTQTECHVGDVIRIAYYIPEGEKKEFNIMKELSLRFKIKIFEEVSFFAEIFKELELNKSSFYILPKFYPF